MKTTAESGFSLAFVVVLVVLAGIVATTMMLSSKKDSHWGPIIETQKRLEKIQKALIAYQRTHKELPCPAPLDVVSSDADYGLSDASLCASGTYAYGAVPFRTLLLPEQDGVDAWDMKITYIMTSALATSVVGQVGTLSVETETTTFNEAAYALISHGKDGGGGYHKNSTTPLATPLSEGVEEENWNGDDHVLNISQNYSKTDDYFDDIVIWGEVDKIAKAP